MNYQKIENLDFKYTLHLMYALALIMFLITILLGIAHSLNVVQFSTIGFILFYLQNGIIGWITLAMITTCFWIFFSTYVENNAKIHNLTLFMKLNALLLVGYVLSFYIDNIYHLSFIILVFSFGVFIMTLSALILCIKQIKNTSYFTGYQYLILIGLGLFLYVNIFGSILSYQLANGYSILIGDGTGLYTLYIETGYLIAMITGIIEWQLINTPTIKTINLFPVIQGIAFLGIPLFFSLGVLYKNQELIILALVLEIIGLVIFFVRIGPKLLQVDIFSGRTDRYLVIASIFLLISLILFIFFTVQVVNGTSLSSLNIINLLFAINHTIVLGAATNVLFAVITINVFYEEGMIPIIENILLIGFNGCLWLFLIAILIESSITIAAYMGIFLLIVVGILLYKIGIIYYKSNQP